MEVSRLLMRDTTIHKFFPKCITRPECDCFDDLQNIVNLDDFNSFINQSINLLIINLLQKEALRKYFQKIKNATSTFITNSLQSTNI